MNVAVRKHRAPKGALRLNAILSSNGAVLLRQKAPSAKRCIKTVLCLASLAKRVPVSESTERQKVH